MPEWRDDAIVLSARAHGEGSAVINLLTREHGRHAGLVQGARGKSARGVYEVGNRLTVEWRARLEDQLGRFSAELASPTAALLMEDGDALTAAAACCALLDIALPEREPQPALFEATEVLLDSLGRPHWQQVMIQWELGLLATLGYGLDLARCGATGASEDLVWVSPKTGRAVSRAAGEAWKDRLLPLPGFLGGVEESDRPILDGFRLTGHFIGEWLLAPLHREAPAARSLLLDRLERATTTSGRSLTE
jgi:DNA repair protein RecO (recombination protein O)